MAEAVLKKGVGCKECNYTGIVPVEQWNPNRRQARTARPCPACSPQEETGD